MDRTKSANHRFHLRCLAAMVGSVLLWASAFSVHAGAGAKIYNEMLEKDQIYDDPAWQKYVTDIGERLLAVSPHKNRKYYFTVLDNPGVNAFATGDAYIFINRGVIAFLKSEDELAGIIGHEIGHVVGGHSAKSRRNAVGSEVLGWVLALMTGTGAMRDLSNTISNTVASGYGRENELEADGYGAEFLARSGYNPHAMLDGIHVLKDHELFAKNVQNKPPVYHGLFASHPKNDKRLYELVQSTQHLMPDELSEPVGDFWEMMDGLVYGDEAATGLIKESTYYHGGLRIVVGFPDGWNVVNTNTEVIGRAPTGSDQASISVQRQDAPSEAQTPEEYITKTLKRDDVKDGESTQINGFEAYVGNVEIAAGNAEARKIAVIFKGPSVYLFKGELGKGGDVAAFEKQWVETLARFRAMTTDDLRIANNQRLKVVEARPGDTYAKLAANSSIRSYPEETLRVINGHHPRGEPRAGDRIKVVQ